MGTLIVATDYSKEAENAVEYACAAAQYLKSDVVLFNSYMIPAHISNARLPPSIFNELLEKNTSLLRNRASELSQKYGISVGYESGFLQLNEKLEQLFSKYSASMVVIGTAADSLGQDLFGNTGTTTILKLNYPVLAVPMGVSFKPIRKILFACDVLRGVNIRILEEVRAFALGMGAEVELFHVRERMKELTDTETINNNAVQIGQGLEGVSHTYKPVESNAVIDGIKDEIRQMDADLLIMVPQRYGFWKSIVHASKTRIMASQSEIPILSIRIN